MVSDEIIRNGLAALSVAAAELVEDHHDELVTTLPHNAGGQLARMQRLRKLGADLLALGEAGIVLLQEPSVEDTAGERDV